MIEFNDGKTKQVVLQARAQIVCMQIIVGKCRREEVLLGRGWLARQRSLAWGVLGLWLATGWVARQPSEEGILRNVLLGSEVTIATRQCQSNIT